MKRVRASKTGESGLSSSLSVPRMTPENETTPLTGNSMTASRDSQGGKCTGRVAAILQLKLLPLHNPRLDTSKLTFSRLKMTLLPLCRVPHHCHRAVWLGRVNTAKGRGLPECTEGVAVMSRTVKEIRQQETLTLLISPRKSLNMTTILVMKNSHLRSLTTGCCHSALIRERCSL